MNDLIERLRAGSLLGASGRSVHWDQLMDEAADEIEHLTAENSVKDESIAALLEESVRIWKVIMDHGLEDEVDNASTRLEHERTTECTSNDIGVNVQINKDELPLKDSFNQNSNDISDLLGDPDYAENAEYNLRTDQSEKDSGEPGQVCDDCPGQDDFRCCDYENSATAQSGQEPERWTKEEIDEADRKAKDLHEGINWK